MTITPRHLTIAALLIWVTHAQADVLWRSVHGADLRGMFVDHELADGVHYAYQFRRNGTFTGFNMGKEIHGTWRLTGNEFCWTSAKRAPDEECFTAERHGTSVRFLRDGYEAFSGTVTRVKSQSKIEAPR